jgi:ABC-type anion transport system duplicated permease subunit
MFRFYDPVKKNAFFLLISETQKRIVVATLALGKVFSFVFRYGVAMVIDVSSIFFPPSVIYSADKANICFPFARRSLLCNNLCGKIWWFVYAAGLE